jgi:hypothetical protein
MKLKLTHIVGITTILILLVILARHTKLCYDMPNELFTGIYVSLASICLIFIFIMDKSILKLLPIPTVTSLLIFTSSAVHGFEIHRGAIFISFVGQLFCLYIFKHLTKNNANITAGILKWFSYLMAIIAVIFIVFGIQYILGAKTYSSFTFGFRALTGLFTSGSYLGYFSGFVLIILILSGDFQVKKLLLSIFLFGIMILSGNRTPLAGVILVILISIMTSGMKSKILKVSLLSFLIIGISGLFLAWWFSPYNYKTIDSGRLLLFYKTLALIKSGFWFGASDLYLDPKTHIAQAHNFYLSTIGEYGIFVFIAYMWYLLWFFKHSGKKTRIFLIYHFFYCLFHPAMEVGFSGNHFLFLIVAIYLNHYSIEEEPEMNSSKTVLLSTA